MAASLGGWSIEVGPGAAIVEVADQEGEFGWNTMKAGKVKNSQAEGWKSAIVILEAKSQGHW